MLKGKMPITKDLPFSWYETPNIHFFTIKDFQNLCKEMNIVIEKSIGLTSKGEQFDINKIQSYNTAIFLEPYLKYDNFILKNESIEKILYNINPNIKFIYYYLH